MLNEPSPDRRVHPLERQPASPPPTGDSPPPRQQVTLHIPTVQPFVTYAILVAIIGVFVVRALSPALDQQLFLWGANHQPEVLNGGEFYRLLSSMFLHASIYNPFTGGLMPANSLHLIFNAYILYMSGTYVERLFGHARFAIIYFLGGLTASIASIILGGPNVYSVGASGAVFAVLGAQFIYLYKHRKLLGQAGRRQMQSLIWLGAINLLFGALTSIGNGPVRVDNWAHIGGALGGLALAWLISPLFIVRRHPEIPTELVAEDINPLRNRVRALSLYAALLLVTLIVASRVV
jgi:rhomboid protease GluP